MKIGIYTRVSTEEQAVHGVSLIAQENALMEYAKKHDYKVVDVYSDEGLSATTLDRPGLQRLLEDVRQGRIDLILITKLDRLSRGVANYYKIADVLENNNCGWKTILEDYDSTTASGRLHINIMLSVAENEAAVTRERINFVFKDKLSKGEIISGQKMFGYKIENKRYVIDPYEAEIVKYIFDDFLVTSSKGKTLKHVRDKFDIDMSFWTISNILKRKLYIGIYVSKGKEYPNFAPNIIPEDVYYNVQSLLNANTKFAKDPNKVFLFSKLIKCSKFKRNLTHTNMNTKYGVYSYIKCNSVCPYYKNGECNKRLPGMRVDKLEKDLVDLLVSQLTKEYKLENHIKTNNYANTSYEKKVRKIKRKMSKLEDMYLDDLISKDKYKKQYNDCKSELEYYNTLIAENNKTRFASIDQDFVEFINTSDFKTLYYSLDNSKKHTFWASLVECIEVSETSYNLIFK